MLQQLKLCGLLPSDERLHLTVARLGGRYRSVNNRRLWALREFARTGPQVRAHVQIFELCGATAAAVLSLAGPCSGVRRQACFVQGGGGRLGGVCRDRRRACPLAQS